MADLEAIRRQVRSRLREQGLLVRLLLRQREQVQGSLFPRYGLCGKATCVCRTGRRHGPYYVLSSRSGGRGAFAYLDAEEVARARDLLARHREFRRGLARLRKLNADLVTLLRRYQQAVVRRGGERMGISSHA
jgi:uncharacterized protein DUF6788